MRRSRRLQKLPADIQPLPKPNRKRYQLIVSVGVGNHQKGGNLPNVYGQRILREGRGGTGYHRMTFAIDMQDWRIDDAPTLQTSVGYDGGLGYDAITYEFIEGLLATKGRMQNRDIERLAREQFKAMHAYKWKDSVRFTNPTYEIKELNSDEVMIRSREPRAVPMLRATPLRMPYLPYNVAAVSLRNAQGRELCVPLAIYEWLISRTEICPNNANNKWIPEEACTLYPNALPITKNSKGDVCRPRVTLENVSALLDAIHEDSNYGTDEGHNVADVEKFIRLFGLRMVALDREGVVIGQVVDTNNNKYPFCFTSAHGHLNWHCDPKNIQSIIKRATHQRMLGSKHFMSHSGAITQKESGRRNDKEFVVVDVERMKLILRLAENTVSTNYLVCGAKDVEDLFFEYGWLFGEPWAKVQNNRVSRFGVKIGEVEYVVGCDPFYEQVLLAQRKGVVFNHRALFESCKERGIAICPLDGLGNAVRGILRPSRKRRTAEERQQILDSQFGMCRRCRHPLVSCKGAQLDHIDALANGGPDTLANLQIICQTCHQVKTEAENENKYANDLLHSSRFSPYTLDVALSKHFQYLEHVESYWCFAGLKIVDLKEEDECLYINEMATAIQRKWRKILKRRRPASHIVDWWVKEACAMKDVRAYRNWWKGTRYDICRAEEKLTLMAIFVQRAWRKRRSATPKGIPQTLTGVRDGAGRWQTSRANYLSNYLSSTQMRPKCLKDLVHHPNATAKFREAVRDNPHLEVQIRKLDANSSRTEIFRQSVQEWSVFTALDVVEDFDGELKQGVVYFVNTANGFLQGGWHGSGWYRYEMVRKGIANHEIEWTNIECQLKPTSTLPAEHFERRVDKLKAAAGDDKRLCKLLPLTDIGCMGRKKREVTFSKFSFSKESAAGKVAYNETGFDATVEEAHTLKRGKHAGETIWRTNFSHECAQDVFALPIFEQIKEEEGIELFNLHTVVQEGGGFTLQTATDAVLYACVVNFNIKTPAEMIAAPDIKNDDGSYRQFPNYYWDEAQTRLKWKWEEPNWNRAERCNSVRAPPTESPIVDIEFEDVWYDGYDDDGAPIDNVERIETYMTQENTGLFIGGGGGTGKSTAFRAAVRAAFKRYGDGQLLVLQEIVGVFAPTNVAARNVNGQTIHKFFKKFDAAMASQGVGRVKMQKLMMALRCIFVDEISMLHTWFWGRLCALQNAYPHLRFVLCGDFDQLDPVCDVVEGICYRDNAALHALTNGKRLDLTICRRADKEYFDLCKDPDAVNTLEFPCREITWMNLSRFNCTRIRINSTCEAHFKQGRELAPIIKKSRVFDRSQDVTLFVDYPLNSRVNDQLRNRNEFWVVRQINVDIEYIDRKKNKHTTQGFTAERVPLEHETNTEARTVTLPYDDFHQRFEPGFCVTTHVSQSMTLRQLYTIHDWACMDTKLRRVALGRAASRTIVQIDDTLRFPDDWGSGIVAGLTFDKAALNESYVEWAMTQCPKANSVLDRFQQYIMEQTQDQEQELEDDDDEEEEEMEDDMQEEADDDAMEDDSGNASAKRPREEERYEFPSSIAGVRLKPKKRR